MTIGQYYRAVNLSKEQFIQPWTFGDGAKLLEFGASAGGLMTALAVLLADGNNRGGGDLRSDHSLIGSWAGDRIVITGDYADPGKFLPTGEVSADDTLYRYAAHHFEDISHRVLEVLCLDPWLKEDLIRRTHWCDDPALDRILGKNRMQLAETLRASGEGSA